MRPSAIRYYESMALLPQPKRIGGQRRYDLDVLRRLAFIKGAQRAGFTIAEIRTLFDCLAPETPSSVPLQSLATRKLAEVDRIIAEAQAMRRLLEQALQCACVDLDDCVLVAG